MSMRVATYIDHSFIKLKYFQGDHITLLHRYSIFIHIFKTSKIKFLFVTNCKQEPTTGSMYDEFIQELGRYISFCFLAKHFFELMIRISNRLFIKVCCREDTVSNSHIFVPWWSGIKYEQSLCPYVVDFCAVWPSKQFTKLLSRCSSNLNLTFNKQPHVWRYSRDIRTVDT